MTANQVMQALWQYSRRVFAPDGLTLLPRKGQPFEKRSTRNEPKVEVYRDNQIDVKGDIY